MESYPLELTPKELEWISDSLTAMAPALPGCDGDPYELILKICGALLEADPAKPPVQVTFVRPELLRLREFAKTQVVIGPERVGYNLLKKVSRALLAVCSEDEVHSAVVRVGEQAEEEKGKSAYRDELEHVKKGDYDGTQPKE